jgi:hypothetical protein
MAELAGGGGAYSVIGKHSYARPGTYSIMVTVTDSATGAKATITVVLTVGKSM